MKIKILPKNICYAIGKLTDLDKNSNFKGTEDGCLACLPDKVFNEILEVNKISYDFICFDKDDKNVRWFVPSCFVEKIIGIVEVEQ